MQIFSLCILILLSMNIAFANTTLPDSCVPVPYQVQKDDIILSSNPQQPKTSRIYFFNNQSAQSIFIEHPVTNPGASAGWSTYIRPGHWSALALNKKNFAVHCSMIQPGKVIALDCSKTIVICTPKNLVTKTNLKGNYWLAEDKDWETFVKALTKKGIGF